MICRNRKRRNRIANNRLKYNIYLDKILKGNNNRYKTSKQFLYEY